MTTTTPDTDYIRQKYHGDVARNYERDRADDPKYQAELRMIPEWLADLPAGTRVLDIPVGTGRFIPLFEERGFDWIGRDVSEGMLQQARVKITTGPFDISFGDVLSIALEDKSVDVSLCLRLLNRLDPPDFVKALKELQRVTRDRIIFNVRVKHRNPRRMRSYEVILGALDGWRIARDEPETEDPNYRLIELRPGG